MRPCRICPTCKRAIAIQTNGTFYQHRDRWAGAPRPVCKWSGLEPPEGEDPMPEPRSTRVEQLRAELAAATARAEQAEAALETLRGQLRDEWRFDDGAGKFTVSRRPLSEADVRYLRETIGRPVEHRLVGEWREAEEGGEPT